VNALKFRWREIVEGNSAEALTSLKKLGPAISNTPLGLLGDAE
jgi:hypothetical protein